MKKWTIAVALVLAAAMQAAASDPIGLVKGGSMQFYQTTTIGQAFDASFDNATWDSFETSKGARIVEFTGTISEQTHLTACRQLLAKFPQHDPDWDALHREYWPIGTPVTVQWTVHIDGQTFELSALSSTAWTGLSLGEVLDAIYQ